MAVKFDAHTLKYLNGLLKRGGKATLALDSRIVLAEVVDGNLELSHTDRHPNSWEGTIDYALGDEVVDVPEETKTPKKKSTKKKSTAKKSSKKSATKKSTKKKAAKKKK